MKTIWLVGKYVEKVESGSVWDVIGVFATQKEAEDACDRPNYFVGPLTLGVKLPDERSEWPGCYYPNCICSECCSVPTVKGTYNE